MTDVPSFDDIRRSLDALERASELHSETPWRAAHHLHHCAASVEGSLDGFPQRRGWFARQVLGPIAKRVVLRRGRLGHDIAEEIPGVSIGDDEIVAQGIERLRRALERFESWTGRVNPHFFFGETSHGEYARLHAMHCAEHLALLRVVR